MVVIAGKSAIFGAHDVAGGRGEGIPVRGASTTKAVPFDLVGGSCGPEQEIVGKVIAGELHHQIRLGAGPVDWPMISSASSKRVCGGLPGLAIRSSTISAVWRPASRTEDLVAV